MRPEERRHCPSPNALADSALRFCNRDVPVCDVDLRSEIDLRCSSKSQNAAFFWGPAASRDQCLSTDSLFLRSNSMKILSGFGPKPLLSSFPDLFLGGLLRARLNLPEGKLFQIALTVSRN
jgi:hypothetical protein